MRAARVAVVALVAFLAATLVAPWADGATAGGATRARPAGERLQDSGAGAVPTRAVMPVDGPVLRPFTAPAHRFGPGHRGVDLAADPGTTIRAALPGLVTFAGEVAGRGWVTVDHGGGLDTTYGVVDPRLVPAGRRVEAGQALGRLAAEAGHLDWGARLHGEYIDPLRLLSRWRPHLVRMTP